MNRERTRPSLSVKHLVIAIIASLLSLVALLALSSRVLLLLNRFERYYEAACCMIWCCESFLIAGISRIIGKSPLLFSILSAAAVSLISLAIGLLFGGGLDLPKLGLHLSLYVCLSFLLSVIPKKKVGKAGKKHRR